MASNFLTFRILAKKKDPESFLISTSTINCQNLVDRKNVALFNCLNVKQIKKCVPFWAVLSSDETYTTLKLIVCR